MNQFITLFGISVSVPIIIMIAATPIPTTVRLTQDRCCPGPDTGLFMIITVLLSFLVTAVGFLALIGVVGGLLSAPASFLELIFQKLDDCLSNRFQR